MARFLTDVHTHSTYSPDGVSTLKEMVDTAVEKGLVFYGVSEHVNYDLWVAEQEGRIPPEKYTDTDEYFHAARHLQDDYAGVINLLVGAEFGYSDNPSAIAMYQDLAAKEKPDFIVNSIHALDGVDYWNGSTFYEDGENKQKPRKKEEVYREYFNLVLRSVEAEYDYDIIGHIGYPTRYAPYEDRRACYADYAKEIDAILLAIIRKDKILEVNSSGNQGLSMTLPDEEILQRYYDLGGRKISFASDAHDTGRVADKRETVVAMLKKIGFTYVTVPCRGEHIKVEI
jgi:histidinol-phosphatase (PHP family)